MWRHGKELVPSGLSCLLGTVTAMGIATFFWRRSDSWIQAPVTQATPTMSSPADPPADSRHVTSSLITFSNCVQSCTHHQNPDGGTQKAYLCRFAAGPFPHPWSQETTAVLSIPPSFVIFRILWYKILQSFIPDYFQLTQCF